MRFEVHKKCGVLVRSHRVRLVIIALRVSYKRASVPLAVPATTFTTHGEARSTASATACRRTGSSCTAEEVAAKTTCAAEKWSKGAGGGEGEGSTVVHEG